MKRHLQLTVTGVCCCLWLIWSLPEAQAGVSEKLREGCQQLAGGRWGPAADAFREAARGDVHCPEALCGEGAANLLAGHHEAAWRCFEQTLTLQPDHGPALVGQATVYFLQQQYDAALTACQAALPHCDHLHQAALQASRALTACLMGQYDNAEVNARLSLQIDPANELGRQVLAASYLARNRSAEALQTLTQPLRQGETRGVGLTAPSPLFSPTAHYYASHRLDQRDGLALAGQHGSRSGAAGSGGNDRPAAAGPAAEANFRILWPRPGTVLQGQFEITVHAEPQAEVQYIAVLVDEQFAGMSNTSPFRLQADSRLAREGLREIRVDGYGADGSVTCSATITVNIANGQHTLSAAEQAVREGVGDYLCELMLLQAHPLHRAQLVGRAYEMTSRFAEAIDAYEYAFSYEPTLPGLRGSLLSVYRQSGLLESISTAEIHHLPGTDRVALTFDDGPHPVLTPWILDLLDQYEAKATFLLVGKQVEMYPELAREIVRRGHEVGSHSYTHANMRHQSTLTVERELVMSRHIIRRATGEFVTLFRPPGGNFDDQVRAATEATGFATVFWTENITSYPGLKGEVILPRMIDRIGRNGIVLLHNGYDETTEVLPLLLPALTQRGLRMDTVSALHPHQPFKLQPLTIYPADWKL